MKQHGDVSRFTANRSQSPPPAHQQVSPITPVMIRIFVESQNI